VTTVNVHLLQNVPGYGRKGTQTDSVVVFPQSNM